MKFTNKEIKNKDIKIARNYDFSNLYEHAHSELSLQQTKRDQIIALYLSICTFLLPFTLSQDSISTPAKGLIFMVIGLIGFLMASIIVRYRVYKEIYWACCQCISQLKTFDVNDIDKETVQALFYQVLKKKSSSFIKFRKNGKVNYLLFVKKNLFSAETLYYVIHSLLTTVLGGLGLALIGVFNSTLYNVILGVAFGFVIFLILLQNYFRNLKEVYQVIIDDEDASFNKTFSKAWFLHFYM